MCDIESVKDIDAIRDKIRKAAGDIFEKLETEHPGILKKGLAAALGSDEAANTAAFIGAGAGSN